MFQAALRDVQWLRDIKWSESLPLDLEIYFQDRTANQSNVSAAILPEVFPPLGDAAEGKPQDK